MKVQGLVVCCVALLVVAYGRVDYTGYQVLRFHIGNEDHVQFISELKDNDKLYFGDSPVAIGSLVTVTVPPTHTTYVATHAHMLGMHMDTVYSDLQSVIDVEMSTVNRKNNLDDFDFDVYNTYDSIMDQLDVWIQTCPEGLECTLTTYGTSFEGREIKVIKIGIPGGNTRAYWLQSGLHSREWLAVATHLKIMDRMWTGYGNDDVVTDLLNTYDWYFTAVANPDGYEYTFTVDRMWRKNRAENEGTDCRGTDLNRNYDIRWGTEGVSHDPCNYEIYCGSGPASELETQAIQAEVSRIGSQQTLLAFLDIHTYGEMILMPFSFTVDGDGEECALTDNDADLRQVSRACADAIEQTFDTNWFSGTACEILYTVSGGGNNWAIDSGGAVYSFTAELRGPSFVVDPSEIQASYQEFWNGVVAMVEEIRAIEGF